MIKQIPSNTWLGISEKIKEFFKENVAKGFFLQLQDTEEEPEYREPYVDLQTLPHKNFVAPGDWVFTSSKPFQAPYILIETQNVRINNDVVTMGIRAIFGVYASGNYEAEDVALIVPDNKAYIDLMNVMQKGMDAVNSIRTFGNAQLAEGTEITADIYDMDTPTYPYAYGYMTFDVQYHTSSSVELNL